MEDHVRLRLTNQKLANIYRRYMQAVTGRIVESEYGLDTCEDFQMRAWRDTRSQWFQYKAQPSRRRTTSTATRATIPKPSSSEKPQADKAEVSSLVTSTKRKRKTAKTRIIVQAKNDRDFGPSPRQQVCPSPTATDPRYEKTVREVRHSEQVYKGRCTSFLPLFIDADAEVNAQLSTRSCMLNSIDCIDGSKSWSKPADYIAIWCAEAGLTAKEVICLQAAMQSHRAEFIAEAKEEMEKWEAIANKLSDEERALMIDTAVARKIVHEQKWDDDGWKRSRDRLLELNGGTFRVEWEWSAWGTFEALQVRALILDLTALAAEMAVDNSAVEERRMMREARLWYRIVKKVTKSRGVVVTTPVATDRWERLAALTAWRTR